MSKITLKTPPRQRAEKPAELEEIKEIIEKFRRRGSVSIFTAVPLEDLAITEKTLALIELINADVLRRIDPKTKSLWEKRPLMYYWDEIEYKKWIDECQKTIEEIETTETDQKTANSLIQIEQEKLDLADRYKDFFLEKNATNSDSGVLETSIPENLYNTHLFIELYVSDVVQPIDEGTPLRQQIFFLDSQKADKWLVRTRRNQILFWLAIIAFIVIIALLILMAL